MTRLLPLLLLAGCSFVHLSRDLKEIRATAVVTGTALADPTDGPVYVVELEASAPVQMQKLPPGGGLYCFLVDPEKNFRVVAFADRSRNTELDADEPRAEIDGPLILAAREQRSLALLQLSRTTLPLALRLQDVPPHKRLPFARGDITTLADPRFDEARAKEGMWEPLTSAETNGFGIYFLAPHDPAKTPVVFVHGMQGSPRDFSALIDHLGPTEEAWLVDYPSGIRLPTLAAVLAEAIDGLRRQHHVEHVRVVAHSMGGLVARAALLDLQARNRLEGIDELVTLATPYNGVASAELGVDGPLATVPSWRDLSPNSDFLISLRHPLALRFRLFATLGARSTFIGGNNDGTVAVSSQLPEWIVVGASQVLTFDVGHVEVLSHASALAQVSEPLARK